MRLQWARPGGEGAPSSAQLRGYVVEYRLKDQDAWNNVTTSQVIMTVRSLIPFGEYEFRVYGSYDVGYSEPSLPASVTMPADRTNSLQLQ